jgi:hypothetical protein
MATQRRAKIAPAPLFKGKGVVAKESLLGAAYMDVSETLRWDGKLCFSLI